MECIVRGSSIVVGLAAFAVGLGIGWGVWGVGNGERAKDPDAPPSARTRPAARQLGPASVGPARGRHVLVRVPSRACEPEGDGGGTGGSRSPGAWPEDVPEGLRPHPLAERVDQALAAVGFDEAYEIDCSEFPCAVVAEGLDADAGKRFYEAMNTLHNPGGIEGAYMRAFGTAHGDVVFFLPEDRAKDPALEERMSVRAKEISAAHSDEDATGADAP